MSRINTWLLAVAAGALIAGCALPLPEKPVRAQTFDLGTPATTGAAMQGQHGRPLAFADVRAPSALDSRHMIYRLAYSGKAQQPRPYALAEWSMPPAQLVRQRLENALAPNHPIIDSSATLAHVELQLDLDAFEQVFHAPDASDGVIRLRVTATAVDGGSHRFLAQRLFGAQIAAPTADAPGGATALRAATDQIVRQISDWIAALPDGR